MTEGRSETEWPSSVPESRDLQLQKTVGPSNGLGMQYLAPEEPEPVPVWQATALDAGWVPSEVYRERQQDWAAQIHEASNEVWDDSVPPGGLVCKDCGTPVESEHCPVHYPLAVLAKVKAAQTALGGVLRGDLIPEQFEPLSELQLDVG